MPQAQTKPSNTNKDVFIIASSFSSPIEKRGERIEGLELGEDDDAEELPAPPVTPLEVKEG